MDIESKLLTACEVTPDGSAILLGFIDTDGKPATIRLSLNQVGALAMALPELINKALRLRSTIKAYATLIHSRLGRSNGRLIRRPGWLR
jgi:hypothetical protein